MTITFVPLAESHFPLLLKWLETPHVKAWWDQDVKWTPELIREKFGNYVKGNKRSKFKDQGIEKPTHAFIIVFDDTPIGYIQYYNKHDFPFEQGYETTELPTSCAGLDWYIGEYEFTGKGIGSKALSHFVESHVFPAFGSVFVDPDTANLAAIRAYEKVGFKVIKLVNKGTITWMLKEQPSEGSRGYVQL
jgi:aminoglycoside 6'-N-acetyltransferase